MAHRSNRGSLSNGERSGDRTQSVWLIDQQLFGVLIARCRKAQHAAPMAVQLSGLAAIFSFELANLYHQQQLRHQTAELTAIPKLQDFIDCLEDHTWIKSVDGKYLATNQSVEQAWQRVGLRLSAKAITSCFQNPERRSLSNPMSWLWPAATSRWSKSAMCLMTSKIRVGWRRSNPHS